MGRKGKKWFGAVKKVFSPECKEKKCGDKSKKKWGFGKSKHADPCALEPIENGTSDGAAAAVPVTDSATHADEIKLAEAESQQSKHVYSVALATAAAAEAAVAAAQAAAEVVRLTTPTKFAGKSREEVAAIKIQTAFRGYLARRALRALRGLVRLKSLIDGNSVKRQATTTLRCMQTLARVQSQIRSRRIRMSEENQALQRQLLLKRERELEKLRMGEEWDDSLQSKQQVEASLLSKQEAAVRRERALAYAFSHQWKSSSRSANPLFMDPNNPQWGWSWLERWMAARPWESRSTTTDKEPTSDQASIKSASHSVGGEITKAYARRDTISDRPSPRTPKSNHRVGRFSPSTPPSKASSTGGKMKSSTSRGGWGQLEDDSRSILSLQSDRQRRHSLGGSSVRDDESLASSPAVPSYMVPTESARAKSRFQGSSYGEKVETPEKGSIGSAKKRLSFPMVDKQNMLSPSVARRLSGPPKVNVASAKEIAVETNGGSS